MSSIVTLYLFLIIFQDDNDDSDDSDNEPLATSNLLEQIAEIETRDIVKKLY